MKTFITSDIHFNHISILKYNSTSRGYDCNLGQPDWPDVEEMNDKIIKNWNSLVSDNDIVFILGDVAMGKIIDAPNLIRQLNGKKKLISGNHDITLKKLIKNNESYNDLFESIHDYYEYSHVHNNKKVMMCMSHFPMRHWHGQNRGTLMLHGHLHGSRCDVPGRIKDVGLDTNNLFPYLLDDVIEELLKIEVMEEHHKD